MGNCLRHESDIIWGGDNWGSPDDWGSPVSEKLFKKDTRQRIPDDHEEEDEILLRLGEIKKRKKRGGARVGGLLPPASSATGGDHDQREVMMKIKITKKEFEELITEKGNVQQMLSQLMDMGDGNHLTHQRSWRPALKSIPE